jgi:hypothetical protein
LHSVAGPERDGDLDNTLIAHEWGHYLHHRLASCEIGVQCTGMSEGWADFNALLMMLRDGDNRDGTYAVSPYGTANGQFDAAYFGIRRFPYSRDRAKNDLSFRHIADAAELPPGPQGIFGAGDPNSEPHNTGEVWASMLWEAFNVLIDAHDVPTARRRMSDYVVAGLLLTPPEATFTEARDAILAGASALDSDDMLVMAAAFAGRGAGTCAVSPSNDALDNAGVIESGTLASRLGLGDLALREDGVSCDHDGYLDPGESGSLRATLTNGGPVAAEDITVTAAASVSGLSFGTLHIALIPPFSRVDVTLPVTALASAPRSTTVTVTVQAHSLGGCDRQPVSGALNAVIGVDESAAVSRVDQVETVFTPWARTGIDGEQLWTRVAEADGNHVWLGKDIAQSSDIQLVSPTLQVSMTAPFVVRVSHAYNFTAFLPFLFDGGVIEISSDGGTTWDDVTRFGVDPGYTGQIQGFGNPLLFRTAFSAISPGYPARQPLVLDFGTQLAGQHIQLRFRIGTAFPSGAIGWTLDDIKVSGTDNTPFPALVAEPAVCTQRSSLASEAAVLTTWTAPATSLGALDAACSAIDGP